MKKLALFLVVILLAIWLGYLVHHDAGYVLISYGSWSLQTSLWIAIIAFIILFFVIYGTLRCFAYFGGLGERFDRWGKQRQRVKNQKVAHIGLRELLEGNYAKAESSLKTLIGNRNSELMSFLAAALAAQEQGSLERRDDYLQQAQVAFPDENNAIDLTRARLELYARHWSQAASQLQALHKRVPKNKSVLYLLLMVYQQTQDWAALRAILPTLRKHKILPEAELLQWEQRCLTQQLKQLTHENAAGKVEEFWHSLSKQQQLDVVLLKLYIGYLLTQQQDPKAIKLIETSLKKQWMPQLLSCYVTAQGDSKQQLKLASNWLNQHAEDADLLYVLGVLSYRQELFAQARRYLQESLAIQPDNPAAYQVLAEVFQQLSEPDESLKAYQAGLARAV